METKQLETQAIVVSEFGAPSVLVYSTKTLPELGPNDVLVDIKAVGVNPVDTYIRAGYATKPPLPYTPGSDGSGIIEAIGSQVKSVKVGERVYLAGTLTGSYSHKAVAKESQVHHLSDNVSFSQGAGIYVPYATAFKALFLAATAKAGQVVFIHGASGGVGIAAVQIARARGLIVIGTASTKEGQDLVLKEGAHYVFNHKEEGYIEQIRELTKTIGEVDIILEMLANVNLQTDLNLIKPRGFIVIIGSRGPIEIAPRDIMSKQCFVTGVMLLVSEPHEFKEIFAALAAGFDNHTLRPIVGQELPLKDASKAHEDIIASTHTGNIVLIP